MTTRAIFVVNARGKWQDSSGSSREVSNPADLKYLIASRRWCDLIVSSGPTVRDNNYSPTQKPLWIISRQTDDFDDLVQSGAEVISSSAKETLAFAKTKFQKVLCEFGPSSLNEIIDAGLLDEFDLSVTGDFNPEDFESLISKLPVKVPISRAKLVSEGNELVVYRFILT